MNSTRGGAALVLVCLIGIVLLVGLYSLWRYHYLASQREVVKAAFNGHIDPDDTSRYEFTYSSWECPDRNWMRDLPPASKVGRCKSFWTDGGGACCIVSFPRGMSAEIHASSLGNGRYKISFDSYLMCADPNYDPSARPGSQPRIPCDDRWRSLDLSSTAPSS